MIKYQTNRKNPISIILFIKSLESIMSFTYLTTEELQWLTGENIWLVYETPRYFHRWFLIPRYPLSKKTNLSDTPTNRKTSAKIIEKMEAEITLNVFDYGAYFPKSAKVEQQYSLVIAKTYLQWVICNWQTDWPKNWLSI